MWGSGGVARGTRRGRGGQGRTEAVRQGEAEGSALEGGVEHEKGSIAGPGIDAER